MYDLDLNSDLSRLEDIINRNRATTSSSSCHALFYSCSVQLAAEQLHATTIAHKLATQLLNTKSAYEIAIEEAEKIQQPPNSESTFELLIESIEQTQSSYLLGKYIYNPETIASLQNHPSSTLLDRPNYIDPPHVQQEDYVMVPRRQYEETFENYNERTEIQRKKLEKEKIRIAILMNPPAND